MHTDSRNPQIKRNEWDETLYGRRVEMDRSWTVYHVFTGLPADAGGGVMTGLSRADATDKMMSLNYRCGRRRGAHSSALPCASMQTA